MILVVCVRKGSRLGIAGSVEKVVELDRDGNNAQLEGMQTDKYCMQVEDRSEANPLAM